MADTDVTRVCVLRAGPEYTPGHAQWLAQQVPGLTVLSDVDVPGIPRVALQHDWSGWFAKMELFRPDLRGDFLYLDLDTVVLGDLAALEGGPTRMLSDFYRPKQVASGFMWLTEEDRAKVWEHWMRDPAGHMRRAVTSQCWGDQGIIAEALPHAERWGPEVVSYKVHCRATGKPPADARVVCFHGQPRPWGVKHSWVPTWPH